METVPVCFRVDKKLLKKLDDVAEDRGYNRAEAVREAVRRFVSE